ncbi:MAG: GNAT family N-acetyltransferase [Candidatus Gastranaerophilaceae bacterium]
MKKFIAGKSINLRDVEIDDAEFILGLRCNEEKSKFLHKTDNSLDEQIKYIENYKNKNNEWYFIIESKDHERLGTIRIYDVQGDDFCWGSWLVKDGAPVTTGVASAVLLYEYAFYELGFNKVHFDVRKENLRVREFHKRFGAKCVREDDIDAFYFYSKADYENVRDKYSKFI